MSHRSDALTIATNNLVHRAALRVIRAKVEASRKEKEFKSALRSMKITNETAITDLQIQTLRQEKVSAQKEYEGALISYDVVQRIPPL